MENMLTVDYSVSNLLVKNSEKHKVFKGDGYNRREDIIYDLELKLTDEEKLNVVDYHTDGLGSYLLVLIQNFNLVKDNEDIIKKTQWGGYNKTSLKKWLKVNDPREVVSIYDSVTYWLFHQEYKMTLDCPYAGWSYKMLYTGEPVVRQWFHDLLVQLNKDEYEWFIKNDSHEIKINTLKGLLDRLGTHDINNDKLSDLAWNNKREGFTDEELDKYISILTDIDEYTKSKKALLNSEVEVCQG